MLNKPPPIPFNLPRGATLAPMPKRSELADTPEAALKELEKEATALKEEVSALKWLAKRKEQEWNSIVGLLKKKEETWLKVKRQAELAMTDGGQSFDKLKSNLASYKDSVFELNAPAPPTVPPLKPPAKTLQIPPNFRPVVPAQAIAPKATPGQPRKILVPSSQALTPEAIKALTSQGMIQSTGVTPDGKRIIVVKKGSLPGTPLQIAGAGQQKPKTIIQLPKNPTPGVPMRIVTNKGPAIITPLPAQGSTTGTASKTTNGGNATKATSGASGGSSKPSKGLCMCCKEKPSKFECAGCYKMWYCSRECQEKDWDDHADNCGKTPAAATASAEAATTAAASSAPVKIKEEPKDIEDEFAD